MEISSHVINVHVLLQHVISLERSDMALWRADGPVKRWSACYCFGLFHYVILGKSRLLFLLKQVIAMDFANEESSIHCYDADVGQSPLYFLRKRQIIWI